jgi:hypothetical protein
MMVNLMTISTKSPSVKSKKIVIHQKKGLQEYQAHLAHQDLKDQRGL